MSPTHRLVHWLYSWPHVTFTATLAEISYFIENAPLGLELIQPVISQKVGITGWNRKILISSLAWYGNFSMVMYVMLRKHPMQFVATEKATAMNNRMFCISLFQHFVHSKGRRKLLLSRLCIDLVIHSLMGKILIKSFLKTLPLGKWFGHENIIRKIIFKTLRLWHKRY